MFAHPRADALPQVARRTLSRYVKIAESGLTAAKRQKHSRGDAEEATWLGYGIDNHSAFG